jgi:alpha-L-rhamnosidase
MTRWLYEDLCGIRPDPAAPGFKHFFLEPKIPAELDSAGTEFQSPYGKVASAWKRDGDSIRWNVTVPWNTTATVKLPGLTKITVNGKPQEKSPFELPAGKWEIVAKQNQNKEPK